jgi:hypothetical protein
MKIYDCVYESRIQNFVRIKAKSLEEATRIVEQNDFTPEWVRHLTGESNQIIEIKEIYEEGKNG